MATKEKIKKYDLLLKKYISNRDLVKVFRTICDKETTIRGFILGISKDLVLIQMEDDFLLDGYQLMRKDDFDSIRCSKTEKAIQKILKAEGILKTQYGLKALPPLKNWTTVFQFLKEQDIHVIIESDVKDADYLAFMIGPLKKVTADKVYVQYYDPTGKLDKKAEAIRLKDIRTVQFGDRYSTIFKKYLRK